MIRRSTRGVVMILEPWIGPKAVGRVWCLFEALTGMRTGARRLEVCVSPLQHEHFRKTVFENIADVLRELRGLDLRNARATVASDWDQISKLVLGSPGGFDAVNGVLRQELGRWLADTAMETLERINPDREWPPEELMSENKLARCQARSPKLLQLLEAGTMLCAATAITILWRIIDLMEKLVSKPGRESKDQSEIESVIDRLLVVELVVMFLLVVLTGLDAKLSKAASTRHLPIRPLVLIGRHSGRVAGSWMNLVMIGTIGYMIAATVPLCLTRPDDVDEAFLFLFGRLLNGLIVMLSMLPGTVVSSGLKARGRQLRLMHDVGELNAVRADEAQKAEEVGVSLRRTQSGMANAGSPAALREAALKLFNDAAAGERKLRGAVHPRTVRAVAQACVQLGLLGRGDTAKYQVDNLARSLQAELRGSWSSDRVLDYWFHHESAAPWAMYFVSNSEPVRAGLSRAERRFALAQLWASLGDVRQADAVAELKRAAEEDTAWLLKKHVTERSEFTTELMLAPGPLNDYLWQHKRGAAEKFIESVIESDRRVQKRRECFHSLLGNRVFVVLTLLFAVMLLLTSRRIEEPAGAGPPRHGLSSDKMALVTSNCGTMRSLSIKWP